MRKIVNIQKNDEFIVDIIDYGYEGEGIAKHKDFTIFVPGALKGERVKIHIVKILTSYAYAKVVEIIKPSKKRAEIDCALFGKCGGCQLRHMTYDESLSVKEGIVQNLVNKTLSNKIKVNPIVAMGNPYDYRNKAIYPVGFDKDHKPQIGSYKQRSHQIISGSSCLIQNEISEKIANAIHYYIIQNNVSVYDEETMEGLLRHVIIKMGFRSHEVMVILVINGDKFPKEKTFCKYLLSEFPEIKTIVTNINKKNTNVILGEKNVTIYGEGYIFDNLGDFTFKISPNSFYQINPVQTEVLYLEAIEQANLTKDDIVYDLYCGIGTIGIFLADRVKKVYGIEIVDEAIKMAEENAEINNIKNIEFYCGDVEKIFMKLLRKNNIYPDVIFVDPPRKGLDKKTIDNLKAIESNRIIYISCNPATLIRDVKLLETKYEVKSISPVDMFPFTSHVESICLLEIKE